MNRNATVIDSSPVSQTQLAAFKRDGFFVSHALLSRGD